MDRINFTHIPTGTFLKVKIALIFFLLLGINLYGQNTDADSLTVWEQQLKTTESISEQLELLNKITLTLSYEKPKRCIAYCKQQEELAIRSKNYPKLIDAYINASVALRELTRFDEALSYNLMALNVSESSGDSLNIAHCNNYLGMFYHIRKDYFSAEKYYKKSFKIFQRHNDVKSQITILGNLSDVYVNTNRQSEALKCLEESIIERKKSGSNKRIGVGYYNLGSVLNAVKLYKKAIAAFDSSIYYLNSAGEKFYYYQVLLLKAVSLSNVRDYSGSSKLLAEALASDIVKQNPDMLYAAYGQMSVNAEMLKNFPDALRYSKYEKSLADTIFQKEKLKSISEAQSKFDTERQEQEIIVLNKEKKINEMELSRQKTIRNIFVVGGILVAVFMVVIIRSLQINYKAKKLISEQKEVLEIKNREVTDSIHYAKRIQTALLANKALLDRYLPEHFIVYKPKDIVSGDFYWAAFVPENGNLSDASSSSGNFFLAACDSTGHGVPGAFMSLLNTTFLNEAINEKNITMPGDVFNHVRKRLIENISHEGAQDGMDGVLIKIDSNRKILYYSAANNKPVIIRKNGIIELKADKMAIGKGVKSDSFSTYECKLEKNDLIYLFTDGFADQFGGPKGKKFKYNRLNSLFLAISELPLAAQQMELESKFNEWKGHLEQVDDICIIGIKI